MLQVTLEACNGSILQIANGTVNRDIQILKRLAKATDSQIQGDENSVALTSQQTFPPIPARFTVAGTGESERIFCGPVSNRGFNVELEFSAEEGRGWNGYGNL
jgi:hypothetical protein